MKRVFVLAVLPVLLLALEKVNLIKDGGFEKNSEAWQTYVGLLGGGELDSVIANRHDSEKFHSGSWSASSDTRKYPGGATSLDSAGVIQGFPIKKTVADLDSLTIHYSLAPFQNYTLLNGGSIGLYLDASKDPYWIAVYVLAIKGRTIGAPPPPRRLIEAIYLEEDTLWHQLLRNLREDLDKLGFTAATTIDSFLVDGFGANVPPWWGQKIYFDDIRLTGYADYDVGVKEILSPTVIDPNPSPYIPKARIKNFGRQPSDSFLVIAEIETYNKTFHRYNIPPSIVYLDTITCTLPADTEDTLEFAAWEYPDHAILTIRTEVPAPGVDESDEDDALSQTIFIAGVDEQPVVGSLALEVESFTANPKVSYSLPDSQTGIISIYDVSGCKVENLNVQGRGQVNLRPELVSGVYFVKLETGKVNVTRKAVILR